MKYFETEKIELKRTLNDSFEKEVVAFLNTHDGTIYIGIDDHGNIVGVEQVDKIMKKIADIISDSILPNAQEFIHYSAIYEEGKIIIKVDVKKGNSLYYIKKYGRSSAGCFIRIGTTSRGMSEEQIEKGFIRNVKKSDELIELESKYVPITFNQLRIYYDSNGYHLNEDTLVQNLNLQTKDGSFNKLAELLSDENHIGLIYARFHGVDKASFGETIDFGNQCIITAIERLFNRLEAENFGMSKIVGAKRIDKKLVNMDCLREAVYNAIINNDWINNRIPIIYRFDNRFEIMSYGGLPIGQTKEDFFLGISRPRSESLMRIMRDLNYTERTGHGVPSIIKNYGKEAFTISDDYVIVTLPFDKEVMQSHIISSEPQNEPLNELFDPHIEKNEPQDEPQNKKNEPLNIEEKIILLIQENPKISKNNIAKALNISLSTIKRIMKNSEKIFFIGPSKSGHWEIKK